MTEKLSDGELKSVLLESPRGVSELLKSAAHPARVRILALTLGIGSEFSTYIQETGLSKTALANHLKQLMETGLVQRVARGEYSLTEDGKGLLNAAATMYKDSLKREEERRRVEYLEKSEEITGYRVKIRKRDAFKVTGYTIIVPPGPGKEIDEFWNEVTADGRLDKLTKASSVRPWVLGLGSWDPECEKHGQRYTICIEETEHTDFSGLSKEYRLFTKEIGASDWMCFETTQKELDERFWRDNPYKMMQKLGYQFHTREGDFSVGLHFDAYPPDYDPKKNPVMEFWITVIKP